MAMLTRLSNPPGSPKALQRFQNCIAFLWPSLQTQQNQRKCTHLDAIDCFTNQLVERKSKKWEQLRDSLMPGSAAAVEAKVTSNNNNSGNFAEGVGLMSKRMLNDLQALRSPQLGLDIRLLSQAQLDNLLLSTLEIKNKLDFLYLIHQCIRWQQLPSNDVLVACLKYLSSLCRLQQIEAFEQICKSFAHPVCKMYANLAPFKAIALWRSGGTDLALLTLQRGYAESAESEEGRRMIKNAFRTVAEETLAQKSAAVLVLLMEVARAIYVEHKDIFVIACIWKQCFISDFFCDQKTATDLYEHYTDLQLLVGRRCSSLCSSFLNRFNVDAVHRLIEAFLQHKQHDACAICLSMLFNYQYLRKDLRACAEIIKSCSELQMPLGEVQNEQFLNLFLNHSEQKTGALPRNNSSHREQKQFKEFQYKF